MLNLINALNPQQWKLIGAAFLGTTGPIAWFLSRKLGLSDADVKMWLDNADYRNRSRGQLPNQCRSSSIGFQDAG